MCKSSAAAGEAKGDPAVEAYNAGATLIRLTCDYAFAQNQGRTQEGGLISCPRFMSEVTRASTEGLLVTAVIGAHRVFIKVESVADFRRDSRSRSM